MPRYFFHLVDSVDIVLDPEGVSMSPDAVAGAAVLQARDCISADVRSGRLRLDYRIDVHDEEDALVHSLPFADALEIVPAR